MAGLREERQKVDLTCTFPDPIQQCSRTINCQVKSGISFRANDPTKGRIRLQNIDKDTLDVLSRDLSILAWVPPKPDSAVYWHIFRPGTAKKKIIINAEVDRISPALRFIIAREAAQLRRAAGF